MKVKVSNYTFNKTTKTVTFTDYTSILLDGILLITNVTDNIIIYNFASPTLGGVVTGNSVTLTYDTSTMDDTDKLQIFYDDGVDVPSSDANQVTLNYLVETLQELSSRLTAIASTVATTAQLRVIGSVAVTSAPSTAVTGPITSAQSIAEKAVAGISYPEKMAITNNTAIQSNVNNTVIT